MEIHVLNRRSFLKKAFLGTISIPIITYLGTGVARGTDKGWGYSGQPPRRQARLIPKVYTSGMLSPIRSGGKAI